MLVGVTEPDIDYTTEISSGCNSTRVCIMFIQDQMTLEDGINVFMVV